MRHVTLVRRPPAFIVGSTFVTLAPSLHTFSMALSSLVQYDSRDLYALTHSVLCTFVLAGPVSIFVNAPHGRFSQRSRFNINARLGWFLMEIVSPISFLVALAKPPLTGTGGASHSSLSRLPLPTMILSALFLIHYAHRAVISVVLHSETRSPMSISIPMFAITFNIANGSLMGRWLGGGTWSTRGAVPQAALSLPLFWIGVGLWAVGFASNVAHDEILSRLRVPTPSRPNPPLYSIPHGLLFDRPWGGISSPAYLSEWIEWTGFALACSAAGARAPPLPPSSSSRSLVSFLPFLYADSVFLIPPWIFVFLEVGLMMPRALNTHRWYHDRFGDTYPKRRRAIVPGLL
jgi:3-oxo-5-alpha-steroid 4-dehydrogenase 1